MKTVTMFEAFTGAVFPTEVDCRAHERENAHRRMIGLTEEQVMAAIERRDPELAEAIEAVGTRIANDRRAAGEFKRARNGAKEAAGETLAIEGPREEPPPDAKPLSPTVGPTVEEMRESGLVKSLIRTREFEEHMRA